jgi:hypothetical protein
LPTSDSNTEHSPAKAIAEILDNNADFDDIEESDDNTEVPPATDDPATCFHILVQVAHTKHIPSDFTEKTLADILTITLAAHTQHLPGHMLLSKIGSITYRNTKC